MDKMLVFLMRLDFYKFSPYLEFPNYRINSILIGGMVTQI